MEKQTNLSPIIANDIEFSDDDDNDVGDKPNDSLMVKQNNNLGRGMKDKMSLASPSLDLASNASSI